MRLQRLVKLNLIVVVALPSTSVGAASARVTAPTDAVAAPAGAALLIGLNESYSLTPNGAGFRANNNALQTTLAAAGAQSVRSVFTVDRGAATVALPSLSAPLSLRNIYRLTLPPGADAEAALARSEERRVGRGGRRR